MKGFCDKVSRALEEVVRKNYGLDLKPPLWEVPARPEFGDLSSMVALKLASKLKKDPLELAAAIKNSLEKQLTAVVDKIDILKPGFINVFASPATLIDSLNGILKNRDRFFRGRTLKKVLIEFLSANPTGPLSIAHGRQAVVGDVIANILEFCGDRVTREYYINDVGRQLDLFGISAAAAVEAIIKGTEFYPPEGGYQGEYIKDIAKDYIKKGKKGDIQNFAVNRMLKNIKKDLVHLGIEFDSWISQKEIIQGQKVKEAIKALKKKGLIFEKEGAVWFLASRFGDDKDRVIKKADGELTYFASDIAYHRDKYERRYDELINLWGPDHHGYIQRVRSVISALGYKENTLKIIIIQLVTLKTKQRMSKRAGTLVLFSELVEDVGRDAARFYYLTRKNSSHLEFDLDLAKQASFDNPLYYIQYVCARIESIFKKADLPAFQSEYSKFLTEPQELNLLRVLLQFSHCLEKAYYSLEPVFIIEFLKSLAAGFHQFYEQTRVLVEEDRNITRARLNLLGGVKTVFHCALNLLGITPVEKM